MNKIVLITGMSGSGKSTVGRLVAEHFSKSVRIKVDQIREMMVKGIDVPDENGFTEATYRQFQWARLTAIYMAQLYASQGVDVVIDDVCIPENFAEQYATLFENPAVYRVLLYPTASALIERINKRSGPWDHLLVDLVPKIYSYLEPMPKEGWIVLDSGEWTIEQTVQELLSRIGAISGSTQTTLMA
jgi:predicted kinase